MNSQWILCLGLGAGLSLGAADAQAKVNVTLEKMEFEIRVKDEGPRGAKQPMPDEGVYPIKGSKTRVEKESTEIIKLNNGLVEVWVAPAFGARLLRAVDVKTGTDYFNWTGNWNNDFLGFGTGGVEPSFPFFEHGVRLRQPAGYRVVQGEDGSATVAMDMRFTHHQKPRDRVRYGRYTEEILNVMVHLPADSSVVEFRMRKENPTPLPRSKRLWNCATYNPVAIMKTETVKDKKTKEMRERQVADREANRRRYKIIWPARWVVDHGPTQVHTSPHWSNPSNWDVSHFAIDAPYGVMGYFDSEQKLNFLRFNDPVKAPASKLYSAFWGWEGQRLMVELWGGWGHVFETADPLAPAYVPVEASNFFTVVHGIGEVTAGNPEVAVAVEGSSFELVSFRPGTVSVKSAGQEVASGPSGPHQPLKGTFDGKDLVVLRDGQEIFRQTFPLDRPPSGKDTPVPPQVQEKFEELFAFRAGAPGEAGTLALEREQIMHNEGLPSALDALKRADSADSSTPREVLLSLARTCYRLGDFARAEKMANLAGGPEAEFVLGLIALEQGKRADFSRVGPEAGYLRALQRIQAQNVDGALKEVDEFLKHYPTAFRPRLARAFWAKDLEAARALSAENPGSPEALRVIELLGGTVQGLDTLLQNNPEAPEQVKAFEAEIQQGRYIYPKRYALIQ